jgi:ribosomal protein S18 acetylase RimI-like enzyme
LFVYVGEDEAARLEAARRAYLPLPREHHVVWGAFDGERLVGMARAVRPGHCWCDSVGAGTDDATEDAKEDEGVLAYRRWLVTHHPATPHWWIGPVAVEPERRGIGIGTELLRDLLDDLRDRDGGEVWLEAEPENETLYLRLGFEIAGRDHDPDGIAFAFMKFLL